MDGRHAGKVIAITGAAGGIGRATAERFASEGASIVLVDLPDTALEESVAAVQHAGGEALVVTADVTRAADHDRYVAEATARFGGLDYFFNNAIKRLVFGQLFDTIPFDRHADGIAGLRRCGEALSRGDGLLLFPEGTRSTTGCMREFKVGVAVLAIEHNVPIVPVYIDRTYALMRKGARFVRPGSVTVSFGEAILPPDREATTNHYAAFGALTERVRKAVDALGGGDD